MATVLLVEDDPAARHGLQLALRHLGYGVRAAETGEAALRDVRDAAADVVVLDVMLPWRSHPRGQPPGRRRGIHR